MRAMGADFVTLDEKADAAEIAKITKAGTGYIDVATASADKVALYLFKFLRINKYPILPNKLDLIQSFRIIPDPFKEPSIVFYFKTKRRNEKWFWDFL